MNSMRDVALALQSSGLPASLLSLLVKATILAAIGAVIVRTLPRSSASARHLVLLATLVSLLLLPLAAVVTPAWRLALLPSHPAPLPVMAAEAEVPSTALVDRAVIDEARRAIVRPLVASLPAPVTETLSAWRAFRDAWRGWVLLTVALVAIASLARIVVGLGVVTKVIASARPADDRVMTADFEEARRQLGVERPVSLAISDRVDVPMICGMWRPTLLLPEAATRWNRDRMRVVFLHELAHIRRYDGVALLVGRVASSFYWFHPLVAFLDRRARLESEQASDDLVLASGTRASDYADHLLAIASALPHHDPFGLVTVAMSRRSQLEGRLLAILDRNAVRASVSLRRAFVVGLAAAAIVIPAASIRLVAAPSGGKASAPATWQANAHDDDGDPALAAMYRTAREVVRDEVRQTRSTLNVFAKYKKEMEHTDQSAFDEGMEALRSGRYDAAVRAFQRSIEEHQRVPSATYDIACAYALDNQKDQAFLWLQRAFDAGFDRADLLIEDDDLNSLRDDPRFEELKQRYASGQDQKRRDEAMAKLQDARQSTDASSLSHAGAELLRLRELDQAAAALSDSLRLRPTDAGTRYNLACSLALQGQAAPALEQLQRAIEDGFTDGKKILSDSDLRSLRSDPRFQSLVELANDFQLRVDEGSPEEIRHYEEVARAHPTVGRAWSNLGFTQLKGGEAVQAEASFHRALDLGYRPATMMYNLACAAAREGNRDAAFDWLKRAAAAGFDLTNWIDTDDDLESIRSDSRFASLADSARAEHAAEHTKKTKDEWKQSHKEKVKSDE